MNYSTQSKMLLAVDCVVFGYDGSALKLLLIKRSFAPEKGSWSLLGGFVKIDESVDEASIRILKELTGLDGLYLEQVHLFGETKRDPAERTVSVVYFALIDVSKYRVKLSPDYHAEWFSIRRIPKLIFDQQEMVFMARKKLQDKAARHPILFELLPDKFTIPQITSLYESLYNTAIDKRNFSKRLLSTGLLIKLSEKNKNSRRGAYYYSLHSEKYYLKFDQQLNFIPSPDRIV
jgi:8-oxo-dGTP diphosphatase